MRPSARQCSGARFSALQSIKSSLYSLQYAPMKNAALFSGPLVTPSSFTFGTCAGIGVGSSRGFAGVWPVTTCEDMVAAAVGVGSVDFDCDGE